LPPNGAQKKSPRNTRSNGGVAEGSFSRAQGGGANGCTVRPSGSRKVTGASMPPVRVIHASMV